MRRRRFPRINTLISADLRASTRYEVGVIALLCALAGFNGNAWAFSFSVEPSRIELEVPAGKQRGKTVRVDNSKSDQPLHIKIYAQDVIFLPDGTSEFPASGSTSWSCTQWVTVVPQEVDIPAGKIREVRVSVTAPEEAKGGYYAMVFFESSPSYLEKGVGINFRIGAFTQVTIPNTQVYQAKLADLSMGAQRGLQLALFNEGNVLIRPKGRVKVLNARREKVAHVEFNPQRLGVLPKTARMFHTTMGNLAAGDYHLRAEIDYGSRYLLVGELDVHLE